MKYPSKVWSGFLAGALAVLACVLASGCAKGGPAGAIPGGDGVSNGGGLSEKNVYFAYFKLPNDLKFCFSSMDCTLPADDEALLRRMHTALVTGVEDVKNLVFWSPKDKPTFFVMDGKPKTARTGKTPGDVIYMNTDHLYVKERDGLRPISVLEGTSMLIHELGHHQGVGNTDAEIARLHQIATTVVNFLEKSAAIGLREAKARPGVQDALVLRCEQRDKNEGQRSDLRIYYSKPWSSGEPYYSVKFGYNPERSPVRVKSGGAIVQVLSDIGASMAFDLRIFANSATATSSTPFATRTDLTSYAATLSLRGDAPENYVCHIHPDALKIIDPLWVLFLR